MNTVSDKLFSLLRAALRGRMEEELSFARADESLWREIYRLASAQGVLAQVWDGIRLLPERLRPPRSLGVQWAYNVDQIERRYRFQKTVIGHLAAFYERHGIRMMQLKGYGLSLLYPVPEHRPCGDIDIWLFGRQAEADRLVAQELHIPVEVDKHHHSVFEFEGVPVENHYDFVNTLTHASNCRLEAELKKYAAQPGERVEAGGSAIYLPAVQFNALFLLRHAAVHFAAIEIGLRHVVDWYVFVERHHAEINWDELYAAARRAKMVRFLDALNAICIDSLGLDSSLIPPFERDAALERRVLCDILSPEFSAPKPQGLLPVVWFKTRRWWTNRWKHRIVYDEGLVGAFIRSTWAHLLKPKSFGAA